jgi:hypothetical protein
MALFLDQPTTSRDRGFFEEIYGYGFLYLGMLDMLVYSMAISGSDSLEVPTIYKAYFSGLCKGISPQNMAMVQYLHFRILKFPLIYGRYLHLDGFMNQQIWLERPALCRFISWDPAAPAPGSWNVGLGPCPAALHMGCA